MSSNAQQEGGTIARCVPGDVRDIVQFVVVFALRHITIIAMY